MTARQTVTPQSALRADGSVEAGRRPISGPTHVIRTGAATLRTEVQARAAYRAQIAMGAFGWVVPLAFMVLWRGAAADGAISGITEAQFTTYFAILLVVSNLWITGSVVFGMSGRIHSGQLSAMLLRPFPPVLVPVAEGIAVNLYRAPVAMVGVPVVIFAAHGAVTNEPADWLLALVVTILGITAMTYVGALVACIAFWMTKADGVMGLVFGLEWVLGGMVAPIALMPGPLPEILAHQPFWYAAGAPAEVMAGIGDHDAWLLVECLVWIVVLHIAFHCLWRRAQRRYEAVGT
ncbi:ABC transporter permease [Oerskovia sp. NPDC060338]|uniref:ABC transporter permease n=1 Tax=Oerskovia sp. NPDC060338 TaxID=3347100 RepID=UPI00364A7CA1